MIQSLRKSIDKVLEFCLISLMTVMVLNVLWQVFSRYILQSPSSFTDELARYLLIWVGLLGAAYVAGKRAHLAIDIFPTRLKPPARIFVHIFIDALIFCFALSVMVIGGARLVMISFHLAQISAALQIKIGYVYLAAPISGALIMFYMAVFVHENLAKLRNIKPEG